MVSTEKLHAKYETNEMIVDYRGKEKDIRPLLTHEKVTTSVHPKSNLNASIRMYQFILRDTAYQKILREKKTPHTFIVFKS